MAQAAVSGPNPPAYPVDPPRRLDEEFGIDEDRTGGLEVVVADEGGSRRGSRGRRSAVRHDDERYDDAHDDDFHDDDFHDDHDDLGNGGTGRRRRRRPLALVLSFVVLAAIVVGIVLGGQRLIDLVNPADEDYSGQGSGTVDIVVASGDSLSVIAATLTDEGVIASPGPFLDAAAGNTAATKIQPGTYQLHAKMSGSSALQLLLDPASRVGRVTIPEGLTQAATLARLADQTGVALADLQAAAADPVALGLPDYAAGQLEGFLYPTTYDFAPGTSAADMLQQMVSRFVETATEISLPERAAAAGRSVHDVVVVASIIRSETKVDTERPNVAQVIYNRLANATKLQVDATVAYGLGKNGNDLTSDDLRSDNPYNTYVVSGLPPSAISSPARVDLEAALAPTSGNYLYYVLQSADGTHLFTGNYDEFLAAKQRCADAGLGCGG